jgi:hypothetical protein
VGKWPTNEKMKRLRDKKRGKWYLESVEKKRYYSKKREKM